MYIIKRMQVYAWLVATALPLASHAFVPSSASCFSSRYESSKTMILLLDEDKLGDIEQAQLDRRQALQQGLGLVLGGTTGLLGASSRSMAATGASDGNLPDLPAEAVRSYLQYRGPLQTSTDFYLFDLLDTLDDPSNWGLVGELFQSKPTRIEREFTNVMRIVGLSMPPEEAEEMREAQYEFEKAMGILSKITLGIRRDLPVELDPQIVSKAKVAWDEGRVGLNKL